VIWRAVVVYAPPGEAVAVRGFDFSGGDWIDRGAVEQPPRPTKPATPRKVLLKKFVFF